MTTQTLIEPTADEQTKAMYNRGMVLSGHEPLDLDTRYAICLVKLGPAVDPSDYPALKAAIEALPGVSEISLVADTVTRDSIPVGTQLDVYWEMNLRIDE